MEMQKSIGTTSELAELAGVESNTVRHSLCTKGHYLGLKPTKAPNRLLYWDLKAARRILGEKVEG